MDKTKYNQLKNGIVFVIGLMMAFGAIRHNYVLSMVTVVPGIVVLYTLRKGVSEVVHDERTAVIQHKAASRTLGYMTALMGLSGLVLVEMSFRGYSEIRDVGYAFAYMANIILGVYALFTWYYGKQMGD
ncbi:MAG: DUF2178 domain-containing protein [Candidatus Bathyarchaeota archaeon]|nr:DUF2178 domain-containing protein [Candidatus Bathyarchaeota archaeon]